MTQQEQPQQVTDFLPKFFVTADQSMDEALEQTRVGARAYRQWLENISDQLLHTPVALGKWSPAEHADHIIKTNQAVTTMMGMCMQGQGMPDVPMGYVHADGRVITLPALVPTPGRARSELLADLGASQRMLEEAALQLEGSGKTDVSCVPTGLFPPLDALEAVQFTAFHYTHHMPQPAATA